MHRMLTPHEAPRFEKFFHRLMRLEMPQAMFDLGDTNETGYQSSYNGENYVLPVVENPPPRVFKTDTFLHPLSDPGAYEPVWSNNEYDGIYAFCSEWLRTGRPELWPVIQRLARHNIEVDFLHYSDHRWLHRATPAHSARHTSTGAYPSHFWTQGLLLYHCLTGDPEALEVATALGEKILENFADPEVRPVLWGFNRELGWPVLALSHLVDLTGDSRQRAQLEELVDFLVSFDRGTFGGAIKLSAGNALHGMNRQIIDNFFGYASMVEGVEHYLSHTPRPQVQQWFEALLQDLTHELAEAHRQGAALSPTHMHALGMAIALDRAGDGRAIDSGMLSLQELIDGPEWASPKPEVKNVTMIHRGFVRFLEHARRQGALAELDYRRGF